LHHSLLQDFVPQDENISNESEEDRSENNPKLLYHHQRAQNLQTAHTTMPQFFEQIQIHSANAWELLPAKTFQAQDESLDDLFQSDGVASILFDSLSYVLNGQVPFVCLPIPLILPYLVDLLTYPIPSLTYPSPF